MSKKIKISESKLLELVTEVQKNILKEYDTNEYENNPANFDVPLERSASRFTDKDKEQMAFDRKSNFEPYFKYNSKYGIWQLWDGNTNSGIEIIKNSEGTYYVSPSYEAESGRLAGYFQPNGFEERNTIEAAKEAAKGIYFQYSKRTNENKSVVGKNLTEQKQLVESIMLSESVIDKFKETLRSGLVTAAVVTALLSAPSISAAEKGEIKKLATSNGIELSQSEPQTTLSSQIVKVNSAGKSMDLETSKKIAMSNARNQGALKVSQMMGNKEFNITNMKIENVKYQQDPSGTYFCAVQVSMVVTPTVNESKLIKEDINSGNVDLTFINDLVGKFKQAQESYNQFVVSNNPFADFSQIADTVKELVYQFDEAIKPAINVIDNLSQEEYDANDDYYNNVQQQIHDLNIKVNNFEYEIEKATKAYYVFSNIQEKLTYF